MDVYLLNTADRTALARSGNSHVRESPGAGPASEPNSPENCISRPAPLMNDDVFYYPGILANQTFSHPPSKPLTDSWRIRSTATPGAKRVGGPHENYVHSSTNSSRFRISSDGVEVLAELGQWVISGAALRT